MPPKRPPQTQAVQRKRRREKEGSDQVFEGVVGQLRELADELNIRSPQTLLREAARRGLGRSLEAAKRALDTDSAKQVLAPKQRAIGKSAAEKPNERLQADLIDMSNNARAKSGNRFALVVQDVFTREVETRPLRTKDPGTVGDAVASAVEELAGSKDVILSTDAGKEFSGVESDLAPSAVHRVKDPSDRNALAVVDRSIQQLKGDMAANAARRGGDWDSGLEKAENAYNNRYHSAVFGAPADVEKSGLQQFRVLQDNADKYQYNRALQIRRETDLKEAGAFRAPVADGGRSFNPRYGPVQQLGRIKEGGQYVTNRGQSSFLLKQVQPVERDSENAVGRLTDPKLSRRGNLRHLTEAVIEYLTSRGEVRLADLQRDVNAGAHNLKNLKMALARGKLRLLTFLRLFGETFVVQSNRVRLKTQAPSPPPAASETREERIRRMLREDRERDERRAAERAARQRERGRAAAAVYGRG